MLVRRHVPVTVDGVIVTADGETVYVVEWIQVSDASRTSVTNLRGAVPVPLRSYVEGLFEDIGPEREAAGVIVSGKNLVPTPAGQLAVRGGSRVVLTLTNEGSVEISHVLAGAPFSPCGGLLIGWDETEEKHFAWRVSEDMEFFTGSEATSRKDLSDSPSSGWNNDTDPGRPVMAELWEKMFLADAVTAQADRNPLLSIDGNGTVLMPAFAFAGGSPSALYPYCLEEYNGVLFIAGHGDESDLDRPELVRHSFLGRSPDDVTGGAEGFDSAAWNVIGAKGQRVTAMRKGRGLLLIAKADELFRLSGFGKAYPGWQYQVDAVQNTHGAGVSNPNALTFVAEADAWFGLGPQGPFRTDGFSLESLVGPRQRGWRGINRLDLAWVKYHPERRLVLYGVHPSQTRTGRSATYPWIIWAWDVDRQRWAPDWDVDHDFAHGTLLTTASATQSPLGPPASLGVGTETTVGGTATWTAADPSAETEIWARDVTASGSFALVATVAAGTESYVYAAGAARRQYEIKARHRKAGLWSEFSATVTFYSLLAAPGVLSVELSSSPLPGSGQLRVRTSNPHNVALTVSLERSVNGAGSWSVIATITSHPPGNQTYYDFASCDQSYDYRARCVDAGWTHSPSAYSATLSGQWPGAGCGGGEPE